MRLLFLIPYLPTPIYVRPYSLLRTLAQRGHTITLFTLINGHEDRQAIEDLETAGIQVRAFLLPRWQALWNAGSTLPSRAPLQAAYCWQPRLLEALRAACTTTNGYPPYDVMHVEHLRGVRYALHIEQEFPGLPIVWDSVDCISYLFRQAASNSRSFFGQWVTRLEAPRTKRFERLLLRHFDHILISSRNDKLAYEQLLPPHSSHTPLHIVSNGVSPMEFFPDPKTGRAAHTLVVSGKMSYHANITMVLNLVEKIMPLVWRTNPEVRLQIVGKDPAAVIQALGSDPRIQVTGTVPHIRPYLQQATLAVAPLTYGAGIQNKVLEAMACGTPVVCSPQAASALQVESGRQLWIASSPDDFAHAIVNLITHPERRTLIGQAGLAYVERYHRWDSIAAQLEGIYQQAQTARISPRQVKGMTTRFSGGRK
ncbi:MAG: glycosyltransferase [Anaerolineales bacterium]